MGNRSNPALAGCILLAIAPAGLSGCGLVGSAGAMRVVSRGEEAAEFSLNLPTRYYDYKDPNTAEFFLTDLPESVWNGGADVSAMNGCIVHILMFLEPKAGRTPLERTATTAAVRVLVLSNGELGVYGGGGFLSQSGSPGDRSFGGSISEGSVQLIRATAGFEDRLGPGIFSGSFGAPLDPTQVAAIRRAFNYLSTFAPSLEAPTTERSAETEPVDTEPVNAKPDAP